jgi:hypothetical protein
MGRAWMLVGAWFVMGGILGGLVSAIRVLFHPWDSGPVDPGPAITGLLQSLLIGATGVAAVWAGRRRFAQAAAEPDRMERARRALVSPRGVRRALIVLAVTTCVVAVAWPFVERKMGTDWFRQWAGLSNFNDIHVTREGEVGFTAALTGRLDPDRVNPFILANRLVHNPERLLISAFDGPGFDGHLEFIQGAKQALDWEKEPPESPDWYGRSMPRPKEICRYGCSTTCLLDRESGRVWIVVEGPDFAGD